MNYGACAGAQRRRRVMERTKSCRPNPARLEGAGCYWGSGGRRGVGPGQAVPMASDRALTMVEIEIPSPALVHDPETAGLCSSTR
jgi:hypothetical protein